MEYLVNFMAGEYYTNILLGVAVFVGARLIGRFLSDHSFDYRPIANLFTIETSTGFNAVYRILIMPLSIVAISIALYLLGLENLTQDIWSISIWYLIFECLTLLFMARWPLVNKAKFFIFHALSILISFYLYTSLITKGVEHLLPDEANLRTDIWLIVIAFIYGLFRSVQENSNRFVKRKENYLIKRVTKFTKKYHEMLSGYDSDFRNILLSIMIYEDFNRPKIFRVAEDIIKSRTRGVMQADGAKSDQDSIKKAIEKLEPGYRTLKSAKFEYPYEYTNALTQLFQSYNPNDLNYSHQVMAIFDEISKK